MEEANKLIEACNHPRDKAFISMLWESGCRISELIGLRLRDVAFDDAGFIINVKGKTGMRRIRLISSTPYVSTWLDVHTFKNNPDMPLWVTISRRSKKYNIRYAAYCKILQTAFSQANIKKRCNPHFFRHSRATYMANHLTEFQMNQYFGWVQGSDMPATYVHMSGKQVDDAIFKMHGLKKSDDVNDKYNPKKCPRCSVINNHDTKLCINCAFILDEAEAMKVQKQKEGDMKGNELMNELMKDPDVQRLLTRKYQLIEKKSIVSGKKERFLIKPQFNEGVNHCFVTHDIAEYLETKGISVKKYVTRKPDITFEINGKRYAVEVETGVVLTKDKKKFLEKVKQLNEQVDYSYFVVLDKNYVRKYKKYGNVIDYRYLINQLEKILKTAEISPSKIKHKTMMSTEKGTKR